MPTQVLLQAPLAAAFTASRPMQIYSERVVLGFELITPGAVAITWYPEFTDENPFDAATVWYRETAEEDIGNGDVKVPPTVRRFTANGADAPLGAGTHALDVQLKRVRTYFRIQIAGLGVTAKITTPGSELPAAAA